MYPFTYLHNYMSTYICVDKIIIYLGIISWYRVIRRGLLQSCTDVWGQLSDAFWTWHICQLLWPAFPKNVRETSYSYIWNSLCSSTWKWFFPNVLEGRGVCEIVGVHVIHWRRKRGGARGGMCPPTFESGGGQRYVCAPPHFQTQNVGLGIEPTDICDVTLAWLASRCWARQMCPPPLHILSRSYAVVIWSVWVGSGTDVYCWVRPWCWATWPCVIEQATCVVCQKGMYVIYTCEILMCV